MSASGEIFVSEDPRLIDFEWLNDRLIRRAYWGNARTAEKIRIAVENSFPFGLYHATANDGRKQIGFARVISDEAIFSTIDDVWIDKDYRKQGHGRRLMNAVLNSPLIKPTMCVIHSRDAVGFYRLFGFEEIANGVMKREPVE